MDYTVCGILQARILEWVAIPFSRDLHNPGIEPRSPALQSDYYSKVPSKVGGTVLCILLGWSKGLFVFFHNIVQKNLNELFGHPNTYIN